MSLAFTTREPYRPAFIPYGARARVGGCACESTMALMASIGMPHAAKMHDPARKGTKWTPQDTLAHQQEEDVKLFPMLRATAKNAGATSDLRIVDRLIADHNRWRPGLLAGVMPSQKELDEHGALEDLLVDRYKLRLVAMVNAKRARAGIGETPFFAPLLVGSDADRMRSITASAGAYYESSPAKGDPSKLDRLSADYPEKAKKAEGEADRKFAEAWVGTKDGAQRIAVEIGGTAALLVIAYPLAIMAVAGWASWEGAKKLWSWIGGGGHGFDPEWTDRAKARIAETLKYGVVPKAFNEADDVSPMGYAKKLAESLNVIKLLDSYAGSGMLDAFRNVTASLWRYAGSDPVIRDDIGNVAKSLDGWPLVWPQKTTMDSPDSDTSRAIVEAVGLAAAHDQGAPVYLWATAIAAAAEGWNNGIDPSSRTMLPRRVLFDGSDFEDGDTLAMPGGGAVGAVYAYQTAAAKVRKAMGIDPAKNAAPDRNTMIAPTMDNPSPYGAVSDGGSWMPWVLGAGATVALGGLAVVSWPVAAVVGVGTWIATRFAG